MTLYHERGGRAIAHAVSCRLPIAAARIHSQVRACGICGGQSCTGIGYLQVLRFSLPILIQSNFPYSSSGAGTIDQLTADVPSGLSLTPPYEIIKKMGEKRNAYTVFSGTSDGKRPFGRPRHWWEGSIKINLKGIEWKGVDWIILDWDRLQCWVVLSTSMNLWTP
jgi:hypothetical protein